MVVHVDDVMICHDGSDLGHQTAQKLHDRYFRSVLGLRSLKSSLGCLTAVKRSRSVNMVQSSALPCPRMLSWMEDFSL